MSEAETIYLDNCCQLSALTSSPTGGDGTERWATAMHLAAVRCRCRINIINVVSYESARMSISTRLGLLRVPYFSP
jgi:hypothetical protein